MEGGVFIKIKIFFGYLIIRIHLHPILDTLLSYETLVNNGHGALEDTAKTFLPSDLSGVTF